jgi:hypothetical protein
MKDEHFVTVLEAREWDKIADTFEHVPAGRELKIQARKLDRMIVKTFKSFQDLFPVPKGAVQLSDLMSGKPVRSLKKFRKQQGKENRAIDKQYRRVLALAEKASREENGDLSRMEVRQIVQQMQARIRSLAVEKFNSILKKDNYFHFSKSKKKSAR